MFFGATFGTSLGLLALLIEAAALALVAGLLVVATFGPGGRSGDRTG